MGSQHEVKVDVVSSIQDANIVKSAEKFPKVEPKPTGPTVPPKKESRERTESVCSENMPDLCPIEDEANESDALPEIFVQIPEAPDDSCQVPSKDLNLFFLTSFDQDNDMEDSDCKISPGIPTPKNLDTNDELIQSDLEYRILADLDQLLESSGIDPNHVMFKEAFVQRTIAVVKDSVKIETTEKAGSVERVENIEQDTESSESETEGNVYDVFDMSMKRLEFIENQVKGIYTDPPTDEVLPVDSEEHDHESVKGSITDSASKRVEMIQGIIRGELTPEQMVFEISTLMKE